MERQEILQKMYGYLVTIQEVSTRRDFAEKINMHESTLSLAFKGNEGALTNNLFETICNRWPDTFERENILKGTEPIIMYQSLMDNFKVSERQATPEEVGIIDLAARLIKDIEIIRTDAKQAQTELHEELQHTRELNETLGLRIGVLDRLISHFSPSSMVAEGENV